MLLCTDAATAGGSYFTFKNVSNSQQTPTLWKQSNPPTPKGESLQKKQNIRKKNSFSGDIQILIEGVVLLA